MWKVFQRLASTHSAKQVGATVYCLEFSDKPMFLVQQNGASSTDVASKSTSTNQGDGSSSLQSEQG